jgi:hypothetical protein
MLINDPGAKFFGVGAGLLMDNRDAGSTKPQTRSVRRIPFSRGRMKSRHCALSWRRSSSSPRVQETEERWTGDATPD